MASVDRLNEICQVARGLSGKRARSFARYDLPGFAIKPIQTSRIVIYVAGEYSVL